MAGFGGFNEKKKKKKGKNDGGNNSVGSFSAKPVFVAPKIIEKVRKEK